MVARRTPWLFYVSAAHIVQGEIGAHAAAKDFDLLARGKRIGGLCSGDGGEGYGGGGTV